MKRWAILGIVLLAMSLNACSNEPESQGDDGTEVNVGVKEASNQEVSIQLKNTEGAIVGTAVLTEIDTGVKISIDATHLPVGEHGFHIHEEGVCEEPDFKSAGGHFNPEAKSHGFNHPEGPHAGDLPNLEVESDGTVKQEVTAEMVTLEQDKVNSLISKGGTSLMIHADTDDGKSQPAGDAGERIVCGVISN